MALDKNGKELHVGDKVLDSKGEPHVINGIAKPGSVEGLAAIGHAKFVDFSSDVTLVEKHPSHKPSKDQAVAAVAAPMAADSCIVWGNGQ